MANFGSKEAILSEISELFDKMNMGTLQAAEMDQLVALTRELQERVAILRYKSYEAKVFGSNEVVTDLAVESADVSVVEPPVVEQTVDVEETLEEETPFESVAVETQTEQPIFDFNLFEEQATEAPEEETIGFDLFAEPPVDEPSPLTQEPPMWEEPQPANPMPSSTTNAAFEDVPASPEESMPASISESPAPEMDLFRRITIANYAGSRLMMTKLETLVGTFGLNEKLQCISELFGGSSETFSHAISELDQQVNYPEAKKVMARYAALYQWDLESDLTIDFVLKVERRYL